MYVYIYKCTLFFELSESNLRISYAFTPQRFHVYFLGTRTFSYKTHSAIFKIRMFNFAILLPNLQSIVRVSQRSPNCLPFQDSLQKHTLHLVIMSPYLSFGNISQTLFQLTGSLLKITGQIFYRLFLNLGLTDISSR